MPGLRERGGGRKTGFSYWVFWGGKGEVCARVREKNRRGKKPKGGKGEKEKSSSEVLLLPHSNGK